MINSSSKILKSKRPVILFTGLFMALLMFIQEPYHQSIGEQNTQDTEQNHQEENSNAEYQAVAYDVLLPVLQFNLFHSFDLLIEIPEVKDQDFSLIDYSEKAYHNFFETLFRQIIAPNAP